MATLADAYVRVRPNVDRFGPELKREAERAGADAGDASGRSFGSRMVEAATAGAVRGGAQAGREFSGGVERSTSRLRPILNGLFKVAGPAILAGGIAVVTANAVALTSAILPAVGAIGILPGVAAVAAAGLGVMAIATMHLKDALTEATSSRGGARAAAAAYEAAQRRIADATEAAALSYEAAQRRIASATESAARASERLTEARKAEQQRIRDLALDARGAGLAQERATIRNTEAQAALTAAKAAAAANPGDKAALTALRDADLAAREAALGLDEAKVRNQDLQAEQQQTAKVGVEGSKQVKDALREQQSAQQDLRDAQVQAGRDATKAQRDIADAYKAAAQAASATTAAADKQAAALAKLSPSARALALAILAVKSRWADMARSVQDRVWAGVAGQVRALSGTYLPVLRNRLGEVGDSFNVAIRQAAGLAQSKQFVSDVDTTLGNAARTSNILAQAIAPVLSALTSIGAVGSQFLPGLAGGVLSVAERFERFINSARESGKLAQWIGGALEVLRTLGAIAVNVAVSVGAIFKAGGADDGQKMLTWLETATGRMRAFLTSAEGQDKIRTVLENIRHVAADLAANVPRLVDEFQRLWPAIKQTGQEGGQLHDYLTVSDVVIGFLADHVDELAQLLPYLVAGFVAVKIASVSSNIALAIASVANIGLKGALKGHTLALKENTVATRLAASSQNAETAAQTGGIFARGRAVISMVAHKIATIASSVATKAMAAGQWLLNAAMSANPIALVVIAIIALVAGFIYAYKHSETFREIVQGAWHGIQVAAQFAWENVIKPVVEALVWFWQKVLAPVFIWLWHNVIEPVWSGIQTVIAIAVASIKIVLAVIKWYLENVVAPVFRWLWNNVVKPVFDGIGATIKFVWEKVIRPVFEFLRDFIRDQVVPGFKRGVDAIGTAWDKVKDVAKIPIRFVVETVINKGILGTFRKVAGFFGVDTKDIKDIPLPAGFAGGGQIPGPPSTVDNRWAQGPGGVLRVASGEFIVNARDTARALPLLRWINAGMSGGASDVEGFLGRGLARHPGDGSEGFAFANGGLVGWLGDAWNAIQDPKRLIAAPINAVLDRVPGGGWFRDTVKAVGSKLVGGLTSWVTGGGGGDPQVGKAQAFIRAQAGKPYIWASAGPEGYDCSGIVSAVWNLLHGLNPYRHTFSTQIMDLFFPKKGPGLFTAAWSHAGEPGGGSVGHTAAQLGNLMFESRGSRGVVVGSGVTPLSSFARMGHYNLGGLVRSYDTGGLWPTGTIGVNTSGRSEYVLTGSMMDDLVRQGGMRVDKVEVHAFTDRFSLRQVQDELAMHGVH